MPCHVIRVFSIPFTDSLQHNPNPFLSRIAVTSHPCTTTRKWSTACQQCDSEQARQPEYLTGKCRFGMYVTFTYYCRSCIPYSLSQALDLPMLQQDLHVSDSPCSFSKTLCNARFRSLLLTNPNATALVLTIRLLCPAARPTLQSTLHCWRPMSA